jgi:hypothetical protein
MCSHTAAIQKGYRKIENKKFMASYVPAETMNITKCYRLTKKPTPWSRVLLEKLTVTQLVKKLQVFYGI